MTRALLAVRDIGAYGGIGRYIAELATRLPHLADLDAEVIVIGRTSSPWAQDVPRISVPNIPLGGSLALLKLPRVERVTHFPFHETTPFFAAMRGPIVMTIHSVEPLYLPQSEIQGDGRTRFHKLPLQILRASRSRIERVVTPSAFERDKIVAHLQIADERVDVIPHGVRHEVFFPGDREAAAAKVRAQWGLNTPYLFYVGHHQPQKNVARLIKAFVSLRRDDVVLAIAGNTERCAAEYAEAADGSTTVKYLGPIIDDSILAELYRGAVGFCFPSLHESFGLPALEAMASGCAVIAARGSGLEQTVGDAAALFDPRSVEEIAERLALILDDDVERRRLAAAGLARAAAFTWERSAKEHATSYRKASA
ncbi:MAG TPA: glycosyltransferase family 1 protein [Gaiellaceae bacterium]